MICTDFVSAAHVNVHTISTPLNFKTLGACGAETDYDPDEHTADTFHHLHVKVSADRINGMLATKHVEQLGESDLKTALAWRQKNSFMTRKGTNKGVSGV